MMAQFHKGKYLDVEYELTPEQAEEIVERRKQGERGVDLAAEFNVSPQLVCDLYKGR